jgi:hypothetical protein
MKAGIFDCWAMACKRERIFLLNGGYLNAKI